MHRVREHPRNAKLLFAGHERGIHVSVDAGATWSSLNLNMPNVPVDDLLIHPRDNDLIVGTHGRSAWVLDNIAPLEALTSDVVRSDAYLAPPARARLLSAYTPQAWFGAGQFFAPNPESGATIDYVLRDASTEDAQILISDANNQTIRTLKTPARRGLTRVTWDLRIESPVVDVDRQMPAPAPVGGAPQGPLVLPGTYGVTLKAPGAGRELKATLTVDRDPRASFSDADRRTRQTALMDLYALQRTLGTARAAARGAAGQFEAQRKDGRAPNGETGARLTQIQGAITSQLNAIGNLGRAIEGYSGLPTADHHRQVGWAFDEVATIVSELNRLLRSDTAAPPQPIPLPPKRS